MSNRLANIRIATPCSAGWDKMEGTDRVRFCDSCQKNVFNISAMTTREAEALILETDARICMRFYRRSDGTILTEDCPVGLAAARKRILHIATAALSSALTFASLAAAQVQQTITQAVQQVTGQLSGIVIDPSDTIVAQASIVCRNTASKEVFKAESDRNGQFRIPSLPIGQYEIKVEAPGFQSSTKTVVISQLREATIRANLLFGTVTMGGPVTARHRHS